VTYVPLSCRPDSPEEAKVHCSPPFVDVLLQKLVVAGWSPPQRLPLRGDKPSVFEGRHLLLMRWSPLLPNQPSFPVLVRDGPSHAEWPLGGTRSFLPGNFYFRKGTQERTQTVSISRLPLLSMLDKGIPSLKQIFFGEEVVHPRAV